MTTASSALDFRSDTVTKPTPEMRDAMARAEVGDDVMGEDPSVIALEERVAGLLGKASAMFVPSGTMSNLLAILAQTKPGDEILTHGESHIYYYEAGGYASVAGCGVKLLSSDSDCKPGTLSADAIRAGVRHSDVHFPVPTLLTLENTHNRGGGVIWPMEQFDRAVVCAKELGLRVHLDGARLWNAAIGSGKEIEELAKGCDTVSVCLSKGLGCPVGSVLVGDQETIQIARHKRKMLGGGMRQAGVIAAAGLYALDHHYERLIEDHRRASRFAGRLAEMDLFDFDPELVETNLIYAHLSAAAVEQGGDAFAWEQRCVDAGVMCYAESKGTIRFVTHLGIDDQMVDEACDRLASLRV